MLTQDGAILPQQTQINLIMKQHFLSAAAIALGGLALLASCDTTSVSENHQLSIIVPNNRLVSTLYADQASDTVWVQSTDSWKAEAIALSSSTTSPTFALNGGAAVQANHLENPATVGENANTNPAFFKLSPKEFEVKPGYIVTAPLVITTKVPATQTLQQGLIRVTPNTNAISSVTRHVYQVGWLNIAHPIATQKEDSKTAMPNFSEVLSQKGGTTRLIFDLYDSDPATHSLVSDAEWLAIPEAAKQPKKGHHVVELSFGENTSDKARTATLQLSSAGATTVITYVQAGKPKQ